MITILHGDDIAESRNEYWMLRQKKTDFIVLNGITVGLAELQQALSGEDLFGSKKPLFIEDLLSKRKSSKEVETLAEYINSTVADVTLWESKALTSKQIGLFEKALIREFKIPSAIFAFLDALKRGNAKQLLELFHKTLEDKDPEFVLFMLTKQIRSLLALSVRNQDDQSISEISRLAPWQRGKLERQAKLFTTDELITIHSKLYEIELGMKTGGLPFPLADSIDFLLLSI